MKLIAFSFLVLLAACGQQDRADDHSGHANHSANVNASEPAVDHSKMDHSAMDHAGMQSSPGAESAPYELQFIDTMVMHHQAAVDMARLAETRASRPELKALAQNIISDQEKEIAQMHNWRDEYFAGAAPAINMNFPGMQVGMTGMDMKLLESLSGEEFDREFIRQMIPHHEGAVIMAKDSIGRPQKQPSAGEKGANGMPPLEPAERAKLAREFRQLAEAIVRQQESEIKQMRGWSK